MRSAIYSGYVIHNRLLPRAHKFKYSMHMFFIAYNELQELSSKQKFISLEKFNILSFKQKNYLTKEAILNKIKDSGHIYEHDNIFILTHLSYLGFCYNPVSFYYCFNEAGDKVEYLLAEINNTPWDERFVYCFKCDTEKKTSKFILPKQFHISPFMPMNIIYHWFFHASSKKIITVLRSFENEQLMFGATLQLRKSEINRLSILKYIANNILVTHMVLVKIYWQALKLWCKKIPFYTHPRSVNE